LLIISKFRHLGVAAMKEKFYDEIVEENQSISAVEFINNSDSAIKVKITAGDDYFQEFELEGNQSRKIIADGNLIGRAFDVDMVYLRDESTNKETIMLTTRHEELVKVYSNPSLVLEESIESNDSFSFKRQ